MLTSLLLRKENGRKRPQALFLNSFPVEHFKQSIGKVKEILRLS